MSSRTNVMLDLETLGTAPGSVILSIGAVAFDEGASEDTWEKLHLVPISVSSCRAAGLAIDEGTLAWWLRQEPAARKVLEESLADCSSLRATLIAFKEWFPQGARLWGNGANFDNVLLRCAFNAVGMEPPWLYFNDRCFRTMKGELPAVVAPQFEGTKHNALADALHQTRWLQAIWAHQRLLTSRAVHAQIEAK